MSFAHGVLAFCIACVQLWICMEYNLIWKATKKELDFLLSLAFGIGCAVMASVAYEFLILQNRASVTLFAIRCVYFLTACRIAQWLGAEGRAKKQEYHKVRQRAMR